jgi:predicted secreted protein
MEGSLNDKISKSPGEIWLQESALFFFLCIFIVIPQVGLCNGKVVTGDNVVIITKQDNGKEIKAKVGNVIQLELEGLGSAGYKWYLDSLNAEYLDLISEETKAVSDKEKIGAPVLGIWRFKTLKKGFTEIKMDHYRVWEGKDSATDHFGIKLTIQ